MRAVFFALPFLQGRKEALIAKEAHCRAFYIFAELISLVKEADLAEIAAE